MMHMHRLGAFMDFGLLLKIVLIAFGAISLVTFVLYGIDKLKAKMGAWRIAERVLLCFSVFGGGLGGTLGMLVFRHKTRHWYFIALNVLGILIQIAALVLIVLQLV